MQANEGNTVKRFASVLEHLRKLERDDLATYLERAFERHDEALDRFFDSGQRVDRSWLVGFHSAICRALRDESLVCEPDFLPAEFGALVGVSQFVAERAARTYVAVELRPPGAVVVVFHFWKTPQPKQVFAISRGRT